MLFTMGHKWRRGETKEVGTDVTDWPQSSWVIVQRDGELAGETGASPFLIVHLPSKD